MEPCCSSSGCGGAGRRDGDGDLPAPAAAPGPGGRAAPDPGRERLAFKGDVRKLKEPGLTESLEVGYRLSPRGRALLEWLDAPTARE